MHVGTRDRTTARHRRRRGIGLATVTALLASFGAGTAGAAGAAPTAEAPPLVGSVRLEGTPGIGGTLRAVVDPPSAPDRYYGYAWMDGDQVVSTGDRSMEVSWRDFGSSLSVRVTTYDDDGRPQTVESGRTAPISAIVGTSPPTLSASPTAVTVAGTPPVPSTSVPTRHGDVSIERVWLRDGTPIAGSGQTESHTWIRDDSRHRLSFRLTARQASTGLKASVASPSTPVVGSISILPFRLSPTTVKAGGSIEFIRPLQTYTSYPPVDQWCDPRDSWYRDGQLIPGEWRNSKTIWTTDGGARFSASHRVTCTSRTGITFTPATRTSTNSVLVSGRPYTMTPTNNDGFRDIIARRAHQPHYLGFTARRYPGIALYDFFYYTDLLEFDAMSRVVSGGDLNGDGIGDALAQTRSGDLYAYDVNGTVERLWKVGTGWGSMSTLLLAGDLDGNHVGDILARRARDGALVLYSSTGVSVRQGRVVGSGFKTARMLAVSPDATGDAVPDLFALWPDGKLRMYAGRGNGGFKPGVVVGWSGWNSIDHFTDGGDADRDGKADFYAVDRTDRTWVYYGKGNGTLGRREQIGRGWAFTAFG
ncbi:hypothetical protein GCM10023258_14640 [Terrabacter aeriphilus]|uniref:Repeat domain-containing protein n=1 Tax=Terrabacter aeriphilus TaxID=515662 RepID=A0ABP9J803_9MICO